MNWLDYVVLGVLVIIIVCIFIWLVRRKGKGCSGCNSCLLKENCKTSNTELQNK